MIAFTTYLPFIRDKVVKTYRVTKIDWMLITVLLINLLTLIRSFLNYRNPEIVYNWARDPFALISIIAFLLLTVIILGTMLWHYLILKRRYSKRRDCPLNKLKRQEYNKNCADITRTYLEYREEGYAARLLNLEQPTEFVEVEEAANNGL